MIRKAATICRYCKTGKSRANATSSPRLLSSSDQNAPEGLVANGFITPQEWEQVHIEKQKTGEPVSMILYRLGLATESHLKNALELQYGVMYVQLSKVEPDRECLSLLPESLMRQHQLVPITRDGNRLTVAMVDPNNLKALDKVKALLPGTVVKPVVCTEQDFAKFIDGSLRKRRDHSSTTTATRTGSQTQPSILPFVLSKIILDRFVDYLAESGRLYQSRQIANSIMAMLEDAMKEKVPRLCIGPTQTQINVYHEIDNSLRLERQLPITDLAAVHATLKELLNIEIRGDEQRYIDLTVQQQSAGVTISISATEFGDKISFCFNYDRLRNWLPE